MTVSVYYSPVRFRLHNMEMKTSRKMPRQKVVCWLLAALGFLGNVDIVRCDAGSAVYTMCDSSSQVVQAGIEGGIVSPYIQPPDKVNCTLKLTGFPEFSWFGLTVETFTLKCSYNCHWRRFPPPNCNNEVSYVQINNRGDKLCDGNNVEEIYYFNELSTSLNINFYSDYMETSDMFNLTYRVATAISIDGLSLPRELNAGARSSGFIVSHSDYGPDDYKPSTNSQLTLTNVSAVDIHFVVLDLEDYTPCYDYLLIWGANETKICQDVDAGLMGQTITFQASNNRELVLRFVSGSRGQTTGFLLKYTALTSSSIISQTTGGTNTLTNTAAQTLFSISSQTTEGKNTITNITAHGMGEGNTTPTSSARRSSVGVGVGVTLSLVAVIVIVVVIVIFLRRRKRKPMKQCFKNREKPPPQGANGDPGVQDCDIYDLPETSVYLYSDLSNGCRRQCEPDESSANHIYSAPDDGDCGETKRLVNEDSQVYHLADEIDDTYYSVPQGTQAQEVESQSTEPADYKVPTNNTAVGGSSLYDSPRNNTAIAHSDSVYDSPRNNQAVGAKDNNIYYLAEDEENTAGFADDTDPKVELIENELYRT